MEYVELTVEERSLVGSSHMRRMRNAGDLPAIVYGVERPATMLQLNRHEFMMAARGKNHSQVFKFKSSNSDLNGSLAMVKEVQIEPLKERLLHVDFLAVSGTQKLHVKIPLVLVGESPVVKEARGVLSQSVYEIEIECSLGSIPEQLTVDISTLEEGKSIHASDVPLPEGAELYDIADLVIVSMISNKPEADAAEGTAKV